MLRFCNTLAPVKWPSFKLLMLNIRYMYVVGLLALLSAQHVHILHLLSVDSMVKDSLGYNFEIAEVVMTRI